MTDVTTNQITFQKMAKKIANGDYESYEASVRMLVKWLSTADAYYPAARKQIIWLLYIAQLRVREEVGFNRNFGVPFNVSPYKENPFVERYIDLVKTIGPFAHIFSGEVKGLKEGYHAIVATLSEVPVSDPSLVPIDTRTESPSQSLVPPTADDGLDLQVPSAPMLTSEPTFPSVGEAFSALCDQVSEALENPPSVLEEERGQQPSDKIETASPTSMMPHDTSRSASSSDPTETLSPNPTEVKKSEHLIPAPKDPQSTVTAVQQIKKTKVKRKPLEFDVLAKYDEMDLLRKKAITASQPQPKPSDSLDQPAQNDAAMTTSVVAKSDSVVSSDNSGSEGEKTSSPLEEVNIATTTPIAGDLVRQQDSESKDVGMPNQMEVDEPPSISEIETDSFGDGVLVSMQKIQIDEGGNGPNGPLGENEVEKESNAMDIDVEHSKSPIQVKPEVGAQSVGPVALPTHAAAVQSNASSEHTTIGIFGSELRVIARQEGLEDRFRIQIEFDLPESHFALIKKWNSRRETMELDELKTSICVTLGCYLMVDLKEQYDTGRLKSFEQQVSCTPCKWPQPPGSLGLKVTTRDAEINMPLSPPFQVTPDNLFDVSSLVEQGKNCLELRQTYDLRNYLFVLHAHHPTHRQLEQVQGNLCRRRQWHQFLDDFVAPFAYESLADLTSRESEGHLNLEAFQHNSIE